MAEFVVNTTLLAAVLVLLIGWAVGSRRRRRRDRCERAAERRAILAALTHAAAPEQRTQQTGPGEIVPASPSPAAHAPVPEPTLDARSVEALFELLEDRRPSRRGMLAGLLASPRSVWTAGARAGHTVGLRTMAPTPLPEPASERPPSGRPQRSRVREP